MTAKSDRAGKPAPEKTEPDLVPSALAEAAPEPTDVQHEPAAQPVLGGPKYVVLDGPMSYGPVVINGQAVRCRRGEIYEVLDLGEWEALLARRVFRPATAADLARAGRPAAGPVGALTREDLPPGAIKGGLLR